MIKENRLIFRMIDQKDAIDLGSQLPTSTGLLELKKLDGDSPDKLQEAIGPRELVVVLDSKNPAEILDHPIFGQILKPSEAAIFKTDKQGKKTFRASNGTHTLQFENTLIHLVLGASTDETPEDNHYMLPKEWRNVAAKLKGVVGDLLDNDNKELAIFLDGKVMGSRQADDVLRALGMGLGNIGYNTNLYKSSPSEVYIDGKLTEAAATPEATTLQIRRQLSNLLLIHDSEVDDREEDFIEAYESGDITSQVQSLVKFLSECPHNLMTCEVFVRTVQKLFERVKASGANVEMEIYGPRDSGNITPTGYLDELGLNMLQAVHQGSTHEKGPFMIRIKYRPPNANNEAAHLLAGKTMVFDNGGTVPKGKAAEGMQADMMGGASVAAEFARITKEAAAVNTDFVFAVASNQIDGAARDIGDIRVHASGKTTEEKHPDAEGRQVLADVIAAALKLSAKEGEQISAVTSVATLTGAAMLMGGHRPLIISEDRKGARAIEDEAHKNGDRMQYMALDPEDFDAMSKKAKHADLRNHAPEGAVPGARGSQTGAAYIKLAAGIKDIPYYHFDIASGIAKHSGATPNDVQGEMGADGYLSTLHAHVLGKV